MGFEDLDEAAGEQSNDTDREAESETTTADETPASEQPTTETTTEQADSSPDPTTDPAFPYSEVVQDARYVREETDTAWEDARDLEVERVLRQHDVRNVAGREYDDALFRLGADHPELVAKYVMEARGLDVADDLGGE